jgi:hypothetical protein
MLDQRRDHLFQPGGKVWDRAGWLVLERPKVDFPFNAGAMGVQIWAHQREALQNANGWRHWSSAPAKERVGIALVGRGIVIPNRRRSYVFIQRQLERNDLGAFLVTLSKMWGEVMIGHDRHLSLCDVPLSRICATCKYGNVHKERRILQEASPRCDPLL